jgi:hypothetical protein
LQKVEWDENGNAVAIYPRWAQLYRRAPLEMQTAADLRDPESGQSLGPIPFPVVVLGITAFLREWMLKEYPGSFYNDRAEVELPTE